MRVLLAEDNPTLRGMLQKAIEQFGYECLSARDGQEAWQLFLASKADAIISDWMMPALEGIEFCRRVRAQAQTPYTYFILMTALDDKQHLLMGMQAGADDYLTKPVDLDELRVRLIAAERVTTLQRQLCE